MPILNGLPYLARQLDAISRQEAPWVWELVVVDNGSDDGSIETVRTFAERIDHLRLIEEPVRGKSRALNRGVEASSGSLLVFLDQDDEIADGYLAAMGQSLERFSCVASRLDCQKLNQGWLRNSRPTAQETGIGTPLGFLPAAAGCSLGIRRDAFEAIDGFDPRISISDDIDFCWRLQLAGYGLRFVPEAVLYYRYRDSMRDIFAQARSYGAAGPAMYRRYRCRGMPRRSIGTAVRFHGAALIQVIRARSRSDWAYCVFLIGFRLGILESCARNRILYL